MAGIMDKLRSLKHNISGVTEPTTQIFNKFVIEESLKYVNFFGQTEIVFKFTFFHPFSSSEWKTAIRDKNCPCKINAVARAKHLTERLRVRCLQNARYRPCLI